MTDHTPEPWECRENRVWRKDASGPWVAKTSSSHDAARIVACVNACAGIKDPGVIPNVVELLRELAASHTFTSRAYAATLLARLTGTTETKHTDKPKSVMDALKANVAREREKTK